MIPPHIFIYIYIYGKIKNDPNHQPVKYVCSSPELKRFEISIVSKARVNPALVCLNWANKLLIELRTNHHMLNVGRMNIVLARAPRMHFRWENVAEQNSGDVILDMLSNPKTMTPAGVPRMRDPKIIANGSVLNMF